jgi:subfamily B ATP-binding cassette protein HlyB/CyaB
LENLREKQRMQGAKPNPTSLPDGQLETQAALWLLGSLCNLHRSPFNARLVAQAYPPPYDLATLIDAARSLGFQAALCRRDGLDWAAAPLPAVAFLKPAPVSHETSMSLA